MATSVPWLTPGDEQLCKPNTVFELDTVQINGRPTTVWKHLPKTFRTYLLESLAKHGDKVLINAPAVEPAPATQRVDWTFTAVRAQALQLAAWLATRGIKQGSLVGLVGWNSAEWAVAWVAVHICGGVPVMVNAAVQPDSMVHCLKLTKPALVLADAISAVTLAKHASELKAGGVGSLVSWQNTAHLGGAKIETIDLANLAQSAQAVKDAEAGTHTITDLNPESDAVIFFTSGTTGYPKAVLSSQRAALHGVISSWYRKSLALVSKVRIRS